MVLVTGAAGAIGRAAAEHFNAQGWRVLATDIAKPSAALPDGMEFFQADLSVAREIQSIGEQVQPHLKNGLNALVNSAAYQIEKPLVKISAAEWDQAQAVNLRAPFLLTQLLYPALKQVQGAVVNVAYVQAAGPPTESGTYAAGQGGLLALTRAMAIEFAPDSVRANAVLAGATTRALLGRPATPEEIAPPIYFLADNRQSGHITGQRIVVDGGARAQLGTE